MDVAEQIVVMNDGGVEQAGTPFDLYEHPRTPFVMSFIGPVNKLGPSWVRPHDVQVRREHAPGAQEAMIERIALLGFETRVELTLVDGSHFWVQLTKAEAELLELSEGEIVFLRPRRSKSFTEDGQPHTDELAVA